MPHRPVSLVLLSAAALAAAGSALAALPPPPTVSVPTVTLPLPPPPPLPLPVPPPPPPAITVPPPVEVPPAPPPQPTDPPPAPVAPAAPPPLAPATSSADYTSGRGRKALREGTSKAARPSGSRRATIVRPRAQTKPRTRGVKGVAAAASSPVQGRPAEGAGFFGPIGTAFNALDVPREVVPTALFAMAALAILLLGLASAPLPGRATRTGAMIVHMRGSIAVAGTAALLLAVATYLLL